MSQLHHVDTFDASTATEADYLEHRAHTRLQWLRLIDRVATIRDQAAPTDLIRIGQGPYEPIRAVADRVRKRLQDSVQAHRAKYAEAAGEAGSESSIATHRELARQLRLAKRAVSSLTAQAELAKMERW